MANMSIVKFQNLQPGLNTFCQNGEYLRMSGNIKASEPGVQRRNKERFQICVFWSMRGAAAYEFDQRLTFVEQIVPLPVPSLGSHSRYFHLTQPLESTSQQLQTLPSSFHLNCRGLRPGIQPLLLSLLYQLSPPFCILASLPSTQSSCFGQIELSGIELHAI